MTADGHAVAPAAPAEPPATVGFDGARGTLFGRILHGYLLMLPTLGLYRFWLTTTKRRFYWSHTSIDGDALEYTGNARQLLVGFLFAIVVFLPIYLALLYFSTQIGPVAIFGYLGAALVLWFLAGYAIYRGRDFRLSRTLWRGIRLDQKGSALAYALRRFLWSILVVVTLGLAYPFMVASLWRYRYRHTWYGDRQLDFVGSWKTVAGPYYRAWFTIVLLVALVALAQAVNPGLSIAALLLLFVAAPIAFCYWRAREASRMFSAVRLGSAALEVSVGARALAGQFLLYLLALAGAYILLGFAIYAAWLVFFAGGAATPFFGLDPRLVLQSGWGGAAQVVGGYLAVFATFTLMGEVVLDFGYWQLVARGARIGNPAELRTARAAAEDPSLLGEGLADALNVGSF